MPTYDMGYCACCDTGTGTGSPLCECTGLPSVLTLTIDAVVGISCPSNINALDEVTLTYNGSGWAGEYQANDGEWLDFFMFCDETLGGDFITLRVTCRASGISSTKAATAGYSCSPASFFFDNISVTGGCCGGTAGTIDCSVVE